MNHESGKGRELLNRPHGYLPTSGKFMSLLGVRHTPNLHLHRSKAKVVGFDGLDVEVVASMAE